jgi:hypothetical protein
MKMWQEQICIHSVCMGRAGMCTVQYRFSAGMYTQFVYVHCHVCTDVQEQYMISADSH